jgi:dephospho-CoA kinase
MFVIGVTGGIGSGKSTVASIISSWDVPVLDADEISREVTGRGGEALPELAEAFGSGILTEDGSLDRGKLADLIFHSRPARDLVNAVVHRHVLEKMGVKLEALEKKKVKAVVLDVPLPVEHGFLDRTHFVVAVAADDKVRLERLMKRGLTEADAMRRMKVQLSREEYRERAQVEIDNSGTPEELEQKVRDLIIPELSKRGIVPAGLKKTAIIDEQI